MSRREATLAAAIAVGLGCITYGVWLAWAPLGWIVGGLSFVVVAILLLVEV